MILKPKGKRKTSKSTRKETQAHQKEDSLNSKTHFYKQEEEEIEINTPIFKRKKTSKKTSPKKSLMSDDTQEPTLNKNKPSSIMKKKSTFAFTPSR